MAAPALRATRYGPSASPARPWPSGLSAPFGYASHRPPEPAGPRLNEGQALPGTVLRSGARLAPKRRRLRRRASAQRYLLPPAPPPLPEKETYGSLLPVRQAHGTLLPPCMPRSMRRSSLAARRPLRAKHACSHRAFGYVFTAAPRALLSFWPVGNAAFVTACPVVALREDGSALRALRSERAAVCPASKVSPPSGPPPSARKENLRFPTSPAWGGEPFSLPLSRHSAFGTTADVCVVPHAIQLRCDQAGRSDGSTYLERWR